MARNTHKRLLVLFVLLALIVTGVVLTGQAIADVAGQANQAKTLDRDLEPVVVEGARVAALIGAPVEDLFVYTFTGNSLSGPIPVQVDEVTASGSYTTTEDGLLDANDEIVFMAMDLGDRPTDTTALTGTLTISDTWYEIEVTDPLSLTKKGWAYLVRSGTLTPGPGDDYVDIITTSQRITITARHYELGLTTAYEAIDYLAVNGSGVDILDRTKLRVLLEVLGVPTTVTEQSLLNPEITFVKDGPVRVILQRSVQRDLSPIVEVNLDNTYRAYASLFQTTSDVNFDLGSSTTLSGIRTSIDLNSVASGATFYNANTPGGVTVDGSPDPVAETPFSNWAQVGHTTGRVVQVTDPTSVGDTQKNYYCDDDSDPSPGSLECDDTEGTGDYVSYGDSGFLVEGDVNPVFTLWSSLFVLPPGQEDVGATYKDYFFNPLIIAPSSQAGQSTIFLPIIFKNG